MLWRKTWWFIIDRIKDEKHYAFIIDVNTLMNDHPLHRERKHFFRYCLHAFSTEETWKWHANECLKLVVKKSLRSVKMMNVIDSIIMKGKQNCHLWFMLILNAF